MTDKAELKEARDYVWQYFALHANQRVAVFNFFVVMSGALIARIGITLQGSNKLAAVGIALGALLSLLSFVFWKLDQRVSFLIKQAETGLASTEQDLPVQATRLFTEEPVVSSIKRTDARFWTMHWTYGTSFRLIFVVMASIGLASTFTAALRFTGKLVW